MIVFSEITCRANTTDYVATGLVGGTPICYDDLAGWRIFDDFLQECEGSTRVNVEVHTYGYGEGYQVAATPEEVAYMLQRLKSNPDFLKDRCVKIRQHKIDIDWEANEIWKPDFLGND